MDNHGSRLLALANSVCDLINSSKIVPVIATVDVVPDKTLEDLSSLLVCVTPFSFSSEPASRADGISKASVSVMIASPAQTSDFPELMGYTDYLAEMLENASIPNSALQKLEFKPVYDSESYLENGLFLSIIRLNYTIMSSLEE